MTWRAARLLGVGAAALCAAAPGVAQDSLDPGELDPSAPMAPLPELGVAWPDMDDPDAPEPGAAAPGVTAEAPVDETTSEIRYSYVVEGMKGVSDEAAILQAFHAQSALEKGRKKSANVAQISRRSRADADLLHQLLRSHGYYDAMVQPRIEGSSAHLEVRLEVDAGEQYRFVSVELPGLEAAGEDYEKLRDSFAVNTCAGCHRHETDTRHFMHITMLEAMEPADKVDDRARIGVEPGTPEDITVLSNVLAADIAPGGGRFEDFTQLLLGDAP